MAETGTSTRTTTKSGTTRAKKRGTREATEQDIAARAYEISESEAAGTPEENWLRAEQELRGRATETAP